MPFRIYKNGEVVAEGDSPLAINGIEPNTDVADGEYQASRFDNDIESERVDVPGFKTLPVEVTGVAVTPKNSSAVAGTAGTRQLSATVSPEDATDKSVTYSIMPNAEGLTVSSAGLISWTEEVPFGVYITTVTTADGGFTDTNSLTLNEPETEEPVEETEG